MHKIVKDVFMTAMTVTIAFLLYYILFGVSTLDGNAVLFGTKTAVITQSGDEPGTADESWQGVLYYLARSLENPIAKYYYDYCLVPNVHHTDYLDAELGCKIYGKDFSSLGSVTGEDYSRGNNIRESLNDYITYPTNNYYSSTYTVDSGW